MICNVVLQGCDDSTEFFVDLTDDEMALVERLSTLSKEASSYGCMPTLNITRRTAS